VRRLLHTIYGGLASRVLPPLVIGCFLLLYIGIAFGTNDTLIALMEIARTNVILLILLTLLPLNHLIRMLQETARHLKVRRLLHGATGAVDPGLFDETVLLSASASFAGLEGRLAAEGYQIRSTENSLAAWRGIGNFPARICWRAATLCLFAGILISLNTRVSTRGAVIEGERLPAAAGGGKVERVVLADSRGMILSKALVMEVAPPDGGARRVFGLYPPSLYRGAFVYPRYLGIGLFIRFAAPDLPGGYEKHCILNIHPAGKEDSAEIPGSPSRIILSLARPEDGSDPYKTGRMTFLFKLFKGKEVLFAGGAPAGGEFVSDGYRLSFPDARRLVITDFIRDYGVLLIWAASLLFVVAVCLWLPVRIFFPRKEMLFLLGVDALQTCSRAEGGRSRHAGVFHDALDLIEARRSSDG
jgi:hypothetical protein